MASSVDYPVLTRAVGHPSIGFLQVEGRRITQGRLADDDGKPAPLVLDQGRGNRVTAFIDEEHEAYERFGADPVDFLLAEVAAVLKVQTGATLSVSQLMTVFRAYSYPDTELKAETVTAEAKELLQEIRNRMAIAVDRTGEPGRAFAHLSPDELTITESAMIANGNGDAARNIGQSGAFLSHVPPLFLVRLLEEWPDPFMDGRVFRGPYASVTSAPARRLSLAITTDYLSDIASHVTFDGKSSSIQLRRTRLTIGLLNDQLGDEG
jgi:hypothetical protein